MNQLESAWQQFRTELNTVHVNSLTEARRDVARLVNQALRRMLQYSDPSEWYPAVLDGSAIFSNSVAVIAVEAKQCQVKAFRNLDVAPDASIPLSNAAAFQNAIESRETIVTLRALNEVSDVFASALRADQAAVVPILNQERTVALIFATIDEQTNIEGLELIANSASLVLERKMLNSRHVQIGQPVIATPQVSGPETGTSAPVRTVARVLPRWANFDDSERQAHLRAQRFARVRTAEWQLFKAKVCQAGRAQKNVYMFLKSDIDSARDAYRKQFMASPLMVDYLHLEMVRVLAENDEVTLGADYPGQMV